MRAAAVLTLISLTTPLATYAEDNRHFLFTGDGVAQGEGRLGLGLNMIFATAGGNIGFLPSVDVRYARGLTGPLDLRLSLDTLGVYNSFDAGVGVALIRTSGFGLGLRAGVTGVIIVTGEGSGGAGGVFAGTPGVVATIRGDSIALSFGADAPMFFNGFVVTPSQSSSDAGFVPSLRPSVSFEVGSAKGAKFYLRGETTLFFTSGDVAVLGNICAGVHF